MIIFFIVLLLSIFYHNDNKMITNGRRKISAEYKKKIVFLESPCRFGKSKLNNI